MAQECWGEPAQVVEQGCDGVGDGEGGEPGVAAGDGGGEDLELADEHRGGRGADQAEEADDEDGGEAGVPAGQPAVAVEGGRVRQFGDDGERAEVGGRVRGEVEQQRPGGQGAAGGDGDGHQQVAGLADGGVGEQPLDRGLEERGEVAQRHGGGGEDGGQQRPVDGGGGNGRGEQAQQGGERADLGDRRDERGDRRRAAVGDVGDPQVGGHGAGLEQQAGPHGDQPGGDGYLARGGPRGGQGRVAGGGGHAIEGGDAGEHEDAEQRAE